MSACVMCACVYIRSCRRACMCVCVCVCDVHVCACERACMSACVLQWLSKGVSKPSVCLRRDAPLFDSTSRGQLQSVGASCQGQLKTVLFSWTPRCPVIDSQPDQWSPVGSSWTHWGIYLSFEIFKTCWASCHFHSNFNV